MKVLIKESKYNNLIENYILNGYPVVKNVTFTTKDVYLASGDKSERRTIQRTIMKHISKSTSNIKGTHIR